MIFVRYLHFSEQNDQSTDRPSINSAVVSVNLRPLAHKTFKDPVVITLRHSVVSLSSVISSENVLKYPF